MECTEARSRLHPYLDHELDLESSLAIEQHLGSCAACRAAFERQSALQSALRENAAYYRAPASVADRIRHQIGAQRPAPRRPAAMPRWRPLPRWLPIGAAVAATALLTWTAALQYAGLSGDERLAEQVIDGHARSVLTSHLIDVASSDQHTVKPWLSSKLDFSPAVVDLAQAGFPLAGGRLDYLDDRPVAALVYRYRQHVIDLFVWPQAKPGDAPLREVSRRGYNVMRWSEGGMSYWAVSDVNPAEMKKFVEAYSQAR
jgi:anti-sigma factor RsiW